LNIDSTKNKSVQNKLSIIDMAWENLTLQLTYWYNKLYLNN